MSLTQACAEVEAIIERARSSFVATPQPTTAGDVAAGHLRTSATATAGAAQRTAALSGELVTAHHAFTARTSTALQDAASTDTRLSAQLVQAAELVQSGAARLASVAAETRTTARAASTATTPAAQRAILTALRNQIQRTTEIVQDTRRRAGELASDARALDYPTDTPPTAPDPADPKHLPESTLDGIHGTGSKDMPIITAPGELGPPNTGIFPGGTDYVEAIPGSGVWIPSDQISGKLWMPSHPGELAPWNHEEIAPGIWWPRPPAVDPGMDGPSYRGG